VQGISPALVYCQLPIFLLGYIVISKNLKRHFGIGTNKE
jgi:hypothetical protein